MPVPVELALLAGAGLVAGALNAVAGGGSFLTLPVLIFLGLPPAVANATNRVGVLAQNLSGLWAFHRYGVLDWRSATLASLPAVAGAGLGAWAALRVSDLAFTRLLSFAMLAITLWTIVGRRGARQGGSQPGSAPRRAAGVAPATAFGFFLVGLYGGFIQAGVGFFVLAITTAGGLDLVRGNAVKLAAVLLMTVLSLGIFASVGAVDWPRGGALALGNALGGLIGVRLAVLKGHHWLEQIVMAAVVLFAILLWAK